MANGDRMLAVAIGVADSVPRKYLTGAINGARQFQAWAEAQGYETILITDEDATKPVTIATLRSALQTLLNASPLPIHRIILYFAGHGLIRELEEGLWLLSDWRSDLRAVAVEPLKRRLSMFGVAQVSIISDACRSLPADVEQADLVPDAVLGSGPKPVDATIAIDKYIAAQDGAEAFMIPGPDPDQDRCLFTGMLIEALWGLSDDAFSKVEPTRVTSGSLGAYLKSQVPARANDYGLTLQPTISPAFPEQDNYYFTRPSGAAAPAFPPWPPKGPIVPVGAGAVEDESGAKIQALVSFTHLFTSNINSNILAADVSMEADAEFEPVSDAPPAASAQLGISVATPTPRPALQPPPGFSGFGFPDADETALWAPPEAQIERSGPGLWAVSNGGVSTPTLVEYADGKVAATVALPQMFATLVRDGFGVTRLVYHDPYDPAASAAAEAALTALEAGGLRADTAIDLAVKLRKRKHADPVLGVISAYLYDAIGDTDSIRRMAGFYAERGEAIPFDIALLGGLVGVRTAQGFLADVPAVARRDPRTKAEEAQDWTYCVMPPRQGLVGGLWPWMRQGWIFLDDPSDLSSPLILPGLTDLRDGLMRSRFATFERDAGAQLAALCGLQRRDAG